MTGPFSNPTFRTLFMAQIFSLLAIGLMTVALALAAYRIGGATGGGVVLGLLLAVKMVAYVTVAPIAEALLSKQPRKQALIGLCLGRMAVLVPMAFATSGPALAALGFCFFALSAGFTPLFQALLPALFQTEETYGRALAYARTAQTLEAVLSPVLAGAALWLVAPQNLFHLAALCFLGSILALGVTRFPRELKSDHQTSFWARAMQGISTYARTPRLRGLFLLNFALSLMLAWVLVNSVVFAAARLGNAEFNYTYLMAAHGCGAALGALAIPRLLRSATERQIMSAGALFFAALSPAVFAPLALPGFMLLWAGFGAAASLILTPGGLVITKSAEPVNRPSVFAAQFSLSHAGWLVAYPLAGILASALPAEPALVLLAAAAILVVLLALKVWPATDPLERMHSHADLPAGHAHLADHPPCGPDSQHRHAYYIDDLHPTWRGSRA